MDKQTFRYLYGVLFLLFVFGQFVNVSRATKRAGRLNYREKHHLALQIFRKGLGIPWFFAIISYVLKPQWLDWASFTLPMGLRLAGLVTGLLGLFFIWWAELTLGKNFNTTLHLRETHTLITHGPYWFVRHPMYTAISIFGLGMFVLAPANWLIALPGIIGFLVLMAVRIRQEEAVMIEHFGDEYRAYMERTGRFLPHPKR